jgi:hypothetical protein
MNRAARIYDMPDQDQIIDATIARSIQADAAGKHPLLAWVITRDKDAHSGQFVASFVTEAPTPYVMLAETLAELQAQLPAGIMRTDRQPGDPPEVVEIWFLPSGVKALIPVQ